MNKITLLVVFASALLVYSLAQFGFDTWRKAQPPSTPRQSTTLPWVLSALEQKEQKEQEVLTLPPQFARFSTNGKVYVTKKDHSKIILWITEWRQGYHFEGVVYVTSKEAPPITTKLRAPPGQGLTNREITSWEPSGEPGWFRVATSPMK